MTLRHFTAKPPKIGKTFPINGEKFEVLGVTPMTGYRPKRWLVEIRRKKAKS